MRQRNLFILTFGTAPIWVSIAAMFAENPGNDNSYWLVAPWLLVGGIALSVATFGIALVAATVYSKAGGDHRTRQIKAAIALFVMTLTLAILGYVNWASKRSNHEFVERDRGLAEKFVLEHLIEELKSHGVAEGVRVSGFDYEAGIDGLPTRYYVYAYGSVATGLPPSLYVVLAVDRPAKESPVFTFLCTTKRSVYAMDRSKHPCEQGQ